MSTAIDYGTNRDSALRTNVSLSANDHENPFLKERKYACLAPSFLHLRSLRQKAQNAKYFAYSKFLKNYKSPTCQAHLRTASWIRAVQHKPTLQHDHTHRITRTFVPALTNIRYCHNEHSLQPQRTFAPIITASRSGTNGQSFRNQRPDVPSPILFITVSNRNSFRPIPLRLSGQTLEAFQPYPYNFQNPYAYYVRVYNAHTRNIKKAFTSSQNGISYCKYGCYGVTNSVNERDNVTK